MNEMCGDNRFEVIEKAKSHLTESTNIETSEDEMKVLSSFLFRCWQMGWLKQYDDTIEAEPVRHGKWIKFHDELSKCSLCNYPTYTRWNQTDYCPNCGAKMDGGEKNEDGVD